jgi:putative NIF3 family GTP cyclohydrolase 1 type 2
VLLAASSWGVADSSHNSTLTAYDVVSRIKGEVTCSWSEETVDTFKSGNPSDEVTGIACTFMATVDVLNEAAAKGYNLIITHEPTYYNHLDSKDKLVGDPVYAAKQEIIDKNKLIIFRFHDHLHRTTPDGIYVGMARKMVWESYLEEGEKNIFNFPGISLKHVRDHLKEVFPEANLRIIGDPNLKINRAAFSAGAPGSAAHFKLLQRGDINLLLIGEAPEWETIEYVRDASQAGLPMALVILGHAVSEEAGMEYCAQWLQSFVTEVPVSFIEAGDPFHQ